MLQSQRLQGQLRTTITTTSVVIHRIVCYFGVADECAIGVCGLSYQETIAKMKERRVDFECAGCRPTFENLEREHSSELRKLRKKRMAPVKKEGLRSRELVPEGNHSPYVSKVILFMFV